MEIPFFLGYGKGVGIYSKSEGKRFKGRKRRSDIICWAWLQASPGCCVGTHCHRKAWKQNTKEEAAPLSRCGIVRSGSREALGTLTGNLCVFPRGDLISNLWSIHGIFCSHSHGADLNTLPGKDIPGHAVWEKKAYCTTAQICYEPNYIKLNTHFYTSLSTYKETSGKILTELLPDFSEKQNVLFFITFFELFWVKIFSVSMHHLYKSLVTFVKKKKQNRRRKERGWNKRRKEIKKIKESTISLCP